MVRWHGRTTTTISNMNIHVGSEAPRVADLVIGALLASPLLSLVYQLLHGDLE